VRELLWVALGGALGSVARFLVSRGLHRALGQPWFPVGTLAVNATGCLVIGFLGSLAESRQLFSADLRIFLFIGLLGGFTTFSSFGYETLALARDGEMLAAAGNVAAQLAFGLIAVWLGYAAGRLV
jgi:fluoride exporter